MGILVTSIEDFIEKRTLKNNLIVEIDNSKFIRQDTK